MKKKQIIIGILISISLASIVTGISLGVVQASRIIPNHQNTPHISGPVMFDNKQFANASEAYDYALSFMKTEEFGLTDQTLYTLTVNNATHVFNSPTEFDNFISTKITTIPSASTNMIAHNLNEDKSIPLNELHKYNIDVETNNSLSNNETTIYKRADGYFFQGGEDALNKAKESYLEIHRGFYFNGIYFKTKQDLESYLTKIYGQQIIDGSAISMTDKNEAELSNYRKIYIKDELGNKIAVSDSIYMGDKNTHNQISNFLDTNAYKYLRIASNESNSSDTYLKFNKYSNQIEGILGEQIHMEDLPVLKKVSNDNKSLYVVDANINEKYNLYGPYFLKTDGNVSNITNPDLWQKSNDSPQQIIRSQSINILAGLFDLILIDPEIKDQFIMDSSGYMSRTWDGVSPLFYISKLSQLSNSNDLYLKEKRMLDSLKRIKIGDTGDSLFSRFYMMYNNMINTKSYSTVFAIPTIYNFIVDNLINYNADVDTVIIVKEYFDALSLCMQDILDALFGDLLYNYEGTQKFSFKKYFQINQYGNDGSNLNSILNGYQLIRDYKGLIAACYVLIKAFGNNQNILRIDYSVKDDKYLYELLEDGKNEDQITSLKIKEKWSKKDSKGYSIIDKLQNIYNTYSNWSVNLDDDLNKHISNETSGDFNSKLENLKKTIINYSSNLKSIDKKSLNELINLQTILNVPSNLKLNNSSRETKKYIRVYFEQNYFQKINTNLEHKKESITEIQSFLNQSKKSIYDDSNGVFKNEIKSGLKSKIVNNLKESFNLSSEKEILKSSNVMIEVAEVKEMSGLEKFELGLKVLGTIGDIGNSIAQIINDVNNPFFDDVQDQLIATGVMNICSSICDLASKFTPPPFDVIVKAAGCVFSFIAGAIGTAEQVIYEYRINDANNTKYYWDGGLVMNRFWGLWKDTKRSIKDLKMQSPIELIKPLNEDIIYFNKHIINDDNDDIIRKKAIKYLIDNNYIGSHQNSKYSWVYSVEPNPEFINSNNSFNSIYELSQYIINTRTNLEGVGEELFINGMKFNNYDDFLARMKNDILDKIQPVYIAKVPELDGNGIPLDNQSSFHMPYPYYEPFNPLGKDLIIASDSSNNKFITANAMDWRNKNATSFTNVIQDQIYISYNSNSINDGSTYGIPINQIYNYIKERFLQSINVESKTILKSNLTTSSSIKFNDIQGSLRSINIYFVELTSGIKKYFLNRQDAVEYILKTTSNQGNILLDMYNKPIISYTNSFGEKLYFNNHDQFNKWFIKNISKVNIGDQ